MGHYCKICGRTRPNEKFSGKGRRIHVCKECARIVLEVALVKPYKKRRIKVLARERMDLLAKLDETGLIMAHHF